MKTSAALAFCTFIVPCLCAASFAQTQQQGYQEPESVNAKAKPELSIQVGHTTGIQQLAVSPNGELLASVGFDRAVKIWDRKAGIELRSISSGSHLLHGVAFSPTKPWIAIASNTLALWDVRTGQQVQKLADLGEIFGFDSIAFSKDGRKLAAGQTLGDIKVWDLDSGQPPQTFHGHQGGVDCLVFSNDGLRLISGGHDKTIRIWNVATAKLMRTLSAPDQVNLVLFNPRGNQLVSAYNLEDKATVWNAVTWEPLRRIPGKAWGGNNLAYRPDGRILAVGDWRSNTVQFLDTTTWQPVGATNRHPHLFGRVVYSPDGRWIATGCWDSVIRIYDPAKPEPVREITGHAHQLRAIALTRDGRWMASTGLDHTVRLWNLETGTETRALPKQDRDDWYSLALSPDGNLVAAGADRFVRVWNSKTAQSRMISTGEGVVKGLAFNLDGTLLAAASNDSLQLRNVTTGQLVYNLIHKGDKDDPGASKVEFSHDGKLLASANKDESASLWDVSTGKELQILSMRNPRERKPEISETPSSLDVLSVMLNYRAVDSLAFSPDNRILFTGASFAGVIAWDVTTGEKVNTFRPKTWSGLPHVALSADGHVLVASNEDGSINVWQSDAPGEPRILPNLGDAVFSLMFHPTGCCLITIGVDGSVRGWDVGNGRQVVRLVPLDENDWAAVDSEGRFDASREGMNLLRWVVGLETIALEQLKERYYDPGLVAKAFGFSNEPLRNVARFTDVDVKLYPEVKLEAPHPGSTKLKLEVVNSGGGIGRVQVMVNGKELLADARAPNQDPTAAKATMTVDLAGAPIKPGEPNEIRVVSRNAEDYLSSGGVTVTYKPAGVPDQSPPELYAILSGISEYSSADIRLRFAAKDAHDMAQAVRLGASRLFGDAHVHLTLLTSPALSGGQAATKANLAQAFEAAGKARPGDVFLVYLAGHGVAVKDTYAYPTQEARTLDLSDPAIERETAVNSEDLVEWIKKVPATHLVMILDTCAAGALAKRLAEKRDMPGDQIRAIERLKDRTGFYVLMGSAADAASYETSQFGQGLLTYSLLKGMKGAALREGKFVDVGTLFRNVSDDVPQLARGIGGIQKPRIAMPQWVSCDSVTNCNTFDIGEFSPEERRAIPLGTIKPLVSRPLFLNAQLHRDNLQLTDALRNRLREESYASVRGQSGSPPPIYVDEDNFAGAASPTGDYSVEGDRVTVTLVLSKDGQEISRISIKGAINNPDALAASIVAEIEKALPH